MMIKRRHDIVHFVENKSKKLQTLESDYFISPSYFNNDGAQLKLIHQLLYYTSKRLGDTEKVILWKSKGMLTKNITTRTTTDNSISPSIKWYEFKFLFSI